MSEPVLVHVIHDAGREIRVEPEGEGMVISVPDGEVVIRTRRAMERLLMALVAVLEDSNGDERE